MSGRDVTHVGLLSVWHFTLRYPRSLVPGGVSGRAFRTDGIGSVFQDPYPIALGSRQVGFGRIFFDELMSILADNAPEIAPDEGARIAPLGS